MHITEVTTFSPALQELIAEYMRSLPFNIDYQSPEKELNDLSAVYSAAAGGAMFVAAEGDTIAGCVALKRLNNSDCEMKRLYVREAFRGRNLGRQLAEAIVAKAKDLGTALCSSIRIAKRRQKQSRCITPWASKNVKIITRIPGSCCACG